MFAGDTEYVYRAERVHTYVWLTFKIHRHCCHCCCDAPRAASIQFLRTKRREHARGSKVRQIHVLRGLGGEGEEGTMRSFADTRGGMGVAKW